MRFIGKIRQENSSVTKSRRPGWIWLTGGIACAFSLSLNPVQAASDPVQSSPERSPTQLVNSPLAPVPDYSRKSDYELTELGARWDRLSQPERGALLREVKLRMAQRKDPDGVLMIRTQRRYGRVYRSDGRYLKIETKVVRVRPAQPTGSNSSFGVGFEQRSAKDTLPDDGRSAADGAAVSNGPASTQTRTQTQIPAELDGTIQSPPVVRVNDPSG